MIDVGKLEADIAAADGAPIQVSPDYLREIVTEFRRLHGTIGRLQRGATIAEVCAGLAAP